MWRWFLSAFSLLDGRGGEEEREVARCVCVQALLLYGAVAGWRWVLDTF
jgi:hypothetical protein